MLIALIVSIFTVLIGVLVHDALPHFFDSPLHNDAFSPDYLTAREKFRVASRGAHAELETFLVSKDAGLSFTVDTAFIQGDDNTSLLVHISGTHGVEGFGGSAIQVDALRSVGKPKASILFVHALNPFGFHHLRRPNENNVDLNRNFFVRDETRKAAVERPPNVAGYDDVSEALNWDQVPQWWHRYTFILPFLPKLLTMDIKKALVSGQYHNPRGIYYGGSKLERSQEIALELARRYLEGKTSVVILDVHSGLGPGGVDTVMVGSAKDATHAREVFPHQSIDDSSAGVGAAAGYECSTGISNWCELTSSRCVHAVQEFGTLPQVHVLRALILEAAAFRVSADTYARRYFSSLLRDAFFVDRNWWKTQILQRGALAIADAIQYLS